MSKLGIPSPQELALASKIRECVLKEVATRPLNKEQLATLLDLYPSGVGGLLSESRWSLETAVRVADALGIVLTKYFEHAAQ
jgi:hypothetical protein